VRMRVGNYRYEDMIRLYKDWAVFFKIGLHLKNEPYDATVANHRRSYKLVASLRLIGASRINASEHFGLGHF
jgi:hypothetical protein